MKRQLIGVAALAALILTGCQASQDVKPIQSGGIVGLQYDPANPSSGNKACWRVTFTAKGQIAYDCADPEQWKSLHLGMQYTANGLPEGEK